VGTVSKTNRLQDILNLAALERGRWQRMQTALRASGVPLNDGDDPPRTVEDLNKRQDEIRRRLGEMEEATRGRVMNDDERGEWNELGQEFNRNTEIIEEMELRAQALEQVARDGSSPGLGTEPGDGPTLRGRTTRGVHSRSNLPDNIYDLFEYRSRAKSLDHEAHLLRDGAMKVLEESRFPEVIERERAQEHISGLIDRLEDDLEPETGQSRQAELTRRIISTGSPQYRRAMLKYLAGRARTPEEERALTVGTGANGGFAVVYTLDPTIIPTSNLSVNPFRAIARQETIAGTNEWRGVTSAGVTATRVAEATEATDNSPTIAQPAVVVQRVQSFVPFSIELGQDWGALQNEMIGMIMDAKDDEEAVSFTTGGGTAPAAQGVLTGATNTVTTGGTATFAVADIYKVWEALPPRFRPRAQWVANLAQFDRVRQFDTAGGASIFVQNLQIGFNNRQGGPQPGGGDLGATLLGRPAWENSAMASTITTGSKLAAVGDWRYFIIVDRVGMDVEVIPHLFGASNR
jgi:HK97 family phage major capsid protein